MDSMGIQKKASRKKKPVEEPKDYLEWLYEVFRSNICEKEDCRPCNTRLKIASLLMRARRSKKSKNFDAAHRHLLKAQELLDFLVENLDESEAGRSIQLGLAIYVQGLKSNSSQVDVLHELSSSLSYMQFRTIRTSN